VRRLFSRGSRRSSIDPRHTILFWIATGRRHNPSRHRSTPPVRSLASPQTQDSDRFSWPLFTASRCLRSSSIKESDDFDNSTKTLNKGIYLICVLCRRVERSERRENLSVSGFVFAQDRGASPTLKRNLAVWLTASRSNLPDSPAFLDVSALRPDSKRLSGRRPRRFRSRFGSHALSVSERAEVINSYSTFSRLPSVSTT